MNNMNMKLYAFIAGGERLDLTDLLPEGTVVLIIEHHNSDYRIRTGSDGIGISTEGQLVISPVGSNVISISEEK